MGFKNLGAYELKKKLEKVYSRVEVSPIFASRRSILQETSPKGKELA
jgi:hypothetical protein